MFTRDRRKCVLLLIFNTLNFFEYHSLLTFEFDAGSSHTGVFIYSWKHRVITSDGDALIYPKSRPLEVVGGSTEIKKRNL